MQSDIFLHGTKHDGACHFVSFFLRDLARAGGNFFLSANASYLLPLCASGPPLPSRSRAVQHTASDTSPTSLDMGRSRVRKPRH